MSYVPLKEDHLTSPLVDPLEEVRLRGSRCRECEEVFFGRAFACGNCGSTNIEETKLSRTGTLYTFTTIWHRPPGDYRGPDPFEPFSIGLVELPDGVRILSPLTGREVDHYTIGAEMELVVAPLYRDADGNDVVSYKFRQVN